MTTPDRSARARRSVRTGATAEWLAIALLMLKGYRILARRFGGKGGEIDLIARRGGCIIFVEVKARAAMDDAVLAITPDKIRLMSRRISDWRSRNAWAQGHVLRADAVFVGHGRWPRHVENVFPLDLT
ncbi:MAG: YraN family protein [Beijerinckiaceae bacterium]|jgi:putative endonuclease|nr:YraN family protein [Beijerinckiaceae bacterium]